MARPSTMTQQTYHVLAALLHEPMHGYAIIKRAAEQSDGKVRMAAGTLYGVLDRLAGDGLVLIDREEVVDGRVRRYFRLTDHGRQALAEEAARMERAARLVTGPLHGASSAGLA
jgi:DNA-binding PadR family transcriptional regulator